MQDIGSPGDSQMGEFCSFNRFDGTVPIQAPESRAAGSRERRSADTTAPMLSLTYLWCSFGSEAAPDIYKV